MKKNINKIVKKVINEAVPLKNFNFDNNGNMSYEQEKPKFKVNTDTGEMSWVYSNGQKADNNSTSSYSSDENMNGLNSVQQNNVQPQQNAEPVQNNVPQSDEELRDAFANGKLEIKYSNGEPLGDYWYNIYEGRKRINVYKFNQYGNAIIESRGVYNIINKEGVMLSGMWVSFYDYKNRDDSEGVSQGLIKVSMRGVQPSQTNLLNVRDGNFISKSWAQYIGFPDKNGLMYIKEDEKRLNYLKSDGSYLLKDWADYLAEFYEGFANVHIRNKGSNFVDANGNFLSNIWFLDASSFNNGFASVYIKDRHGKEKKYQIDKNANLYNEKGKIVRNCNEENRGFFGNLFNRRKNESIDRIVSDVLYEVRQRKMNEEGCGGATSCGGVGVDGNNTINVPMGKVQRRKIYNTNEDLIRNSKELNEVKTMMSRLNKIKK